jgi:hypothetical protein
MTRIFPFEMKIGSFAKVVSPVEFTGLVLKRETLDRWSNANDPSSTWTSPAPGSSMLVEPLSQDETSVFPSNDEVADCLNGMIGQGTEVPSAQCEGGK